MSGDSPSAFTNENVFDFKEGRSSPGPTTSKENNQVVTASVLVEPPKEKLKDKEGEIDEPDFSDPTLNPVGDKRNKPKSDDDKTLDLDDPHYDLAKKENNKEDQNLLYNGLDRLPNPYARQKEFDEESEENKCMVNCVYYTMECCKCSIL